MGPNLFVHNENIAHVMPRDTACAMMSCTHRAECARRQAGHPCGAPGISYGYAICASQKIFIKINCLTFWHPKYEICKPECAGKDSHCHAQ